MARRHGRNSQCVRCAQRALVSAQTRFVDAQHRLRRVAGDDREIVVMGAAWADGSKVVEALRQYQRASGGPVAPGHYIIGER